MAKERIKAFNFREFEIVVGRDSQIFIAYVYDKAKMKVAETTGETIEDAETEAKQKALALSHDFVGFSEALKIFRKHFPQDFANPQYLKDEREYKLKAVTLAQERLTEAALKRWIASSDTEALAECLKKVISITNICSPFEKARFNEYLATPKNALIFAEHLLSMVYGKNFDAAFKDFSDYFRTTDLRSWPVATYYLYVLNPIDYIFLKPQIFQRCAYRLGYDDCYDSQVNPDTYYAQNAMARDLFNKLKPYGARDMIDVQSFMYAIASDGYAAELLEEG